MSLARRMQRRHLRRDPKVFEPVGTGLRASTRAVIIARASQAIGRPVGWKAAKRWLDDAIEAGEIADGTATPGIEVVSR